MPQEYQIKTLQDIFNLPTADAMERCLKELTEMMISTRAMADMLVLSAQSLAQKEGKEMPAGPYFEWPEVATWTDDGSLVGSEIKFADPGKPDETLLTMRIEKSAA